MLEFFCRLADCTIITKEITILAHLWKGYSEAGGKYHWCLNHGDYLYGRTTSAVLYEGPPNKTICKNIECKIRIPSAPQVLNIKTFSPLPGIFVAGRQVNDLRMMKTI